MNITPVSSSMLEAAQKALQQTESLTSAQQLHGKSPLVSFGETLAAHIHDQATVALHPQNVSAAPPSTYRSVALQMIENTQNLQTNASQEVQRVLQGDGSLHNAMIAMEEAGVSFQLLVEMRNKIVESIQELMRMQI